MKNTETPIIASPAALTVTRTVRLEANAGQVWSVIGRFGDMCWHPAVQSTEMRPNTPADRAVRTLHLGADPGDPTITETLASHDDTSRSYSYTISAVDPAVVPVANYSSTLCVRDEAGKATVAWQGSFNPAPSTDEAAAIAAISGIYDAGLAALINRFGARK